MWVLILTQLKNPLVQKILIYAAIVIAALYYIRLYGNAQWSKGETKGRQTTSQVIEKVKKDEWKRVEQTLKEQNTLLADERETNYQLRKQSVKDRIELDKTKQEKLKLIQDAIARDNAYINSIPDSKLDTAIRAISNELRGVATN